MLLVTLITAVLLLFSAPLARPAGPPVSFVEQALCVHSGWHYTRHRPTPGARPEYLLWQHGYWRTWKTWANGEGAWTGTVGNLYGGGMSFMVGTWNRAAALTHGRVVVPYVQSTYGIAALPPHIQIKAAYLIWQQDGGSWREWPQTSRACGYR